MTRRAGIRPGLGTLPLAGVAALALLGRSGSRERLDQRVSRFVQRLPERPAVRASAVVAEAPHQALATAAVSVAGLALLARSRRSEAARLVLASALAAATSVGLKGLLARPRPAAELRLRPVERSGRFPSGHTTSAAIAALAVSRALAGTGAARSWGTAIAAAAALAVGASRVHLAEHYASDVLASYGIVLAAGLALPRKAAGG
jgi:membrane-associated phospholipid phosphatase